MAQTTASGYRPHSPVAGLALQTRVRGAAPTIALLVGAVLVGWSATIHLHLWMNGYRNVATIGPLFLVQSIVGYLVAAAIAVTRRRFVALIGAGFLVSTIAGLLLSAWVGLFGFHDGFDAPFAGLSIVVEGAGALTLALGSAWRRA